HQLIEVGLDTYAAGNLSGYEMHQAQMLGEESLAGGVIAPSHGAPCFRHVQWSLASRRCSSMFENAYGHACRTRSVWPCAADLPAGMILSLSMCSPALRAAI